MIKDTRLEIGIGYNRNRSRVIRLKSERKKEEWHKRGINSNVTIR